MHKSKSLTRGEFDGVGFINRVLLLILISLLIFGSTDLSDISVPSMNIP